MHATLLKLLKMDDYEDVDVAAIVAMVMEDDSDSSDEGEVIGCCWLRSFCRYLCMCVCRSWSRGGGACGCAGLPDHEQRII